jgi:hypothetical protein
MKRLIAVAALALAAIAGAAHAGPVKSSGAVID